MLIDILIWITVFIVSIAVLIKSSDYFTEASKKIGIHFGIPAFIVGVTIVAFGTSLPEIVASMVAVIKDSSEIAVGNVVGSNIANIFLVFGVAAVASNKMKLSYNIIGVDLPFLVGSAFFLAITIWDGTFTMAEGILSLIALLVFILYTKNTGEEHSEIALKEGLENGEEAGAKKLGLKPWIILVAGGLGIYLGANYTVEAIIKLSELLNMGKEVIAVSAVALGTSLPELAVSVTAVKKGEPEISVGNVLGSNVFNALAVMGCSSLIGPLAIPENIINFSLPIMLIGTLLFVLITQDKRIQRWEGWLLLIFYVFFIGRLFKIL